MDNNVIREALKKYRTTSRVYLKAIKLTGEIIKASTEEKYFYGALQNFTRDDRDFIKEHRFIMLEMMTGVINEEYVSTMWDGHYKEVKYTVAIGKILDMFL